MFCTGQAFHTVQRAEDSSSEILYTVRFFTPLLIVVQARHSSITAYYRRKDTIVVAVIANGRSIDAFLIIGNTGRTFTLAFRKVDIQVAKFALIIMDTNHGTARAGIGILTDGDTAGIILAFRCAKSKCFFQRTTHIHGCGIFTNDNAVTLIEIAVDIRIITDGYIASIIAVFIRLSATSPHEVIIADRNTAICTIQNILVTDADDILLIIEISKRCVIIFTANAIVANDDRISQTRNIRIVISSKDCILGIGNFIISTNCVEMRSSSNRVTKPINHIII